MADTKLYGKSLKEYEDIDVDALLSQLTEEELEQLGQDLIDPDVSFHLDLKTKFRLTKLHMFHIE